MFKNKIFRTILNLIGLGAIAKILSMIAKIITVRLVNPETMGIYTMASSSLILLITLVQLGLPATITRMIASREKSARQVIASSCIIVFVTATILTLVIALGSPFFAKDVLKNGDCLLALYALIPLIWLIGFGSIIKAYFIGINKIEYTAIAQISEELARIIFLVVTAVSFNKISPAMGAFGIMLGMSIGEVASIINMILFARKSFRKKIIILKTNLINPQQYVIKDVLPTSLSLTTGRLIGSLTYFAEPIIMTNILLNLGYSTLNISIEYALLSSLAMPLLLLPGFFANAFSNAMLPVLSKDYANKNIAHAKKICRTITFYSGIIGLIFALICFFFPGQLMLALYGTKSGQGYVRFIAFPFILYYIQAPLSTALIAFNKEKSALRDTILGSIVRIIILLIAIPRIEMYGVALATIAGVFVTTFLHVGTLLLAFREQ